MKPKDVTDEMIDAVQAVADRASLFGDPWAVKRAVIAAAINAMPQTDAQAQIDVLKAERDALRKDADLWRYALKRGVVTVHSERIVDHDSGTRCSWIQGHDKSADISNAAIIKETKNG